MPKPYNLFSFSVSVKGSCVQRPSSNGKPIRAHKGHLSNAIRITGQSGHSSDPEKGVNAILKNLMFPAN